LKGIGPSRGNHRTIGLKSTLTGRRTWYTSNIGIRPTKAWASDRMVPRRRTTLFTRSQTLDIEYDDHIEKVLEWETGHQTSPTVDVAQYKHTRWSVMSSDDILLTQ
jgi:hypothetical protein